MEFLFFSEFTVKWQNISFLILRILQSNFFPRNQRCHIQFLLENIINGCYFLTFIFCFLLQNLMGHFIKLMAFLEVLMHEPISAWNWETLLVENWVCLGLHPDLSLMVRWHCIQDTVQTVGIEGIESKCGSGLPQDYL